MRQDETITKGTRDVSEFVGTLKKEEVNTYAVSSTFFESISHIASTSLSISSSDTSTASLREEGAIIVWTG
jgi:predicted fused transcriptional regulator/phosphomethylpyrimidine kinase